ncbi:phage tail family protein [Heyndrickxia oleronia]|uniref:phage tail family protein n=1 Tax=Heyndrickxia oleronia TaxID=38875 RepID=UPI001C0ECEE7|nr:phage tail family protein [Heyndrickxia oleronia]MBU5214961.1 phage tail family protein [Heyndrickxia oleronia]
MKTKDNFKIVTKDKQVFDMLDDFCVLVERFIVYSPKPEIKTDKIDGHHGAIKIDKTFGERKIEAICSYSSSDYYDATLLEGNLNQLFNQQDEFYIIRDLEPGKRWVVETSDEWSFSKIGTFGEFTIQFVSHSSFAESVGTTLDPFTFDAELWQVGQGLVAEDLVYAHSTTSFRIFNAGDVSIDPREYPLVIKYQGASTNLKIKNETTGEEWSINDSTEANDTLTLDGIRSLKNGVSVFGKTNKKLLTIAQGWNDFTLTGTSGSFLISFDFRFYYF